MSQLTPDTLSEQIKVALENSSNRTLRFLLVGRTGVGKSSTINSLLGQEVAPVSASEPTTFEVIPYHTEINGIPFEVVDTPGLCDELPEAGNDEQYLSLIRGTVHEVDCLWYVTRLDETRVSADEKRSIRYITAGLGEGIWHHAVLVFTYANSVPPAKLREALRIRSKLLQDEVNRASKTPILHLPSVAVDNTTKQLSDGSLWLPELFSITAEQLRIGGIEPFVISAAERIGSKGADGEVETDIPLDEEQQRRVFEKVQEEKGPLSKVFVWIKENSESILDTIEEVIDTIPHPKVKIFAVIFRTIRSAVRPTKK